MRRLLYFFMVSLFLTSCDQPIRNRYIGGTTITSTQTKDTENANTDTSNTGGQNEESNGGSNSSTSEPGYENCDLGMTNFASSLGYFGICQKSNDERRFKFVFQNASSCIGGSNATTNCGVCFVPMYSNSQGGDTAIGTAQCVHQEAGKTYYGTFTKSSSYPINGAMVVHTSSLKSFQDCMSAKITYINSHSGCQYNQTCLNYANTYAQQVCSSFVQYHQGKYKMINF